MKKLVLTAALAAVIAAPAAMAGDKVNVVYGSGSERFDVDDLKTISVCALKQRLASKYDIDVKKFDLKKKGGAKLHEDKTLYGAGVRNYNNLEMKEVSRSHQC